MPYIGLSMPTSITFLRQVKPGHRQPYVATMFTRKLRELRESLKLTQKQMAKRLAMEQSTYSRKERDDHPKPEFLERIKKFLGVDPTPWLNDDGSSPDPVEGEPLRIVHLEELSTSKGTGKKKRKGKLSKRDERSLREFIAMGVQYFNRKMRDEEKQRDRPKDPRAGGGVITSCLSGFYAIKATFWRVEPSAAH